MKKSDFYYDLPEHLIAQVPIKNRAQSRLMVLDREKQTIEHRIFKDVLDYLNPGDCLVVNDTRVLPARLIGARAITGAKVEVLLLNPLTDDQWEVMVKPGKKAQPGDVIVFGDGRLEAKVLSITQGGNRIVQLVYEGNFETLLNQLGEMPLPPYITETLEDQERYQTVYAKALGSAAAPTAGLHFTHDLLDAIKAKGIKVASVTLHVGIGTFRPVKVDNILEHDMHAEYYEVTPEAAQIITLTKQQGKRVVAVGTTSCRTLESVAHPDGTVEASNGWTDIFIYPGYQFKCIDGLITNFHLPESTLMMLVSSLAGYDFIKTAYQEAIHASYRFFSFGDAMIIV